MVHTTGDSAHSETLPVIELYIGICCLPLFGNQQGQLTRSVHMMTVHTQESLAVATAGYQHSYAEEQASQQ
jgi:hypothetical protein